MKEKLLQWLDSAGDFALERALPMVLILVIGFVIIHFCIRILGKILEKTKLEKAAHTLIRTVVRVGLYILLFLIAASQLGIDVTGIVALFSVVTLALSLALQNLLTNVDRKSVV